MINGRDFLKTSKEEFLSCGMPDGPARKLAEVTNEWKDKKLRLFSSYLSLGEVLAEYGLDFDGMVSTQLFFPPTYEIQDNKIFKQCIEETLGRLRSYATLQPDSFEAMRNEYVVALLHAAIHIAMDETNKELSMRPQYGRGKPRSSLLYNQGSQGFASRKMNNIKVPVGFAQNIKLLESACEMNKRKRKRSERDGDDFDYLYGIEVF